LQIRQISSDYATKNVLSERKKALWRTKRGESGGKKEFDEGEKGSITRDIVDKIATKKGVLC